MFVSAPGHDSDQGRVYFLHLGRWSRWFDLRHLDTGLHDRSTRWWVQGHRFGHRLAANDNGDILAVSSLAPGNAGKVDIFVRTSQSNDGSTMNSFALTHRQLQAWRATGPR